MTDRELEERLRAWYTAEVGETGTAPDDLRQVLATIPATTPRSLGARGGRRGFTLLAVAAVLVVGGVVAAGSGIVSPRPAVTPRPNVAVVAPSGSPTSETPAATSDIQPGRSIAFIRLVNKGRSCSFGEAPCESSRLSIVGTDGSGAHEVIPDGDTDQTAPVWSPDGTRLLYFDEGKLFLIDASGGDPQPVDTGCASPCLSDSQLTFSSDGARLAFIRESVEPVRNTDLTTVATMDLASGRVLELRSTDSDGSAVPAWSPDGTHIVYFRAGEKDGGGPVPPRLDAIWLVDADGTGLRQLSPMTLAAAYPEWSPDGARILFESIDGEQQDIYTIRPDGTDVRRLTTDGASVSATWTPDGRILFARPGGASPGWWTMNADGTDAALLVADADVGPVADSPWAGPTWQPIGGAALVPPPWKATTGVAVGPPAPTPVPTPVPALAPGFAWTGSMSTDDGGPFGESATLLGDGRVLFAGGCGTATELYDPATGTFAPTGDMTAVRAGSAAALLLDGRVLFTGGYNCAPAGQDGVWASAELYDPATGTFSPTGSMGTPREFQTATRLADGRVLIAGGYTAASPSAGTGITLASYRLVESSASVLKTAEVYDPATGTFTPTGSMSSIRDHHTATVLKDGKVLVLGGGGEGYASQKTAELYDPATGRFSQTGSMKTGRWLQTATLLQDGSVLVAGGRSPQDSVYKSAEIYDPATGRFHSAGSMDEARQQQTATLLPDGRVFIAGGYWSDGQKGRVLSSTEMFDPATGKSSGIGSMGAPRDGHTATLLNDGRILIAGGEDIGNSGGFAVAAAVLYQP
jgi:Kelch motif/Galactose oxidase, central domain/WD40-like Beta Propeller Repeat